MTLPFGLNIFTEMPEGLPEYNAEFGTVVGPNSMP
jgi:hypothetical protein